MTIDMASIVHYLEFYAGKHHLTEISISINIIDNSY